MDSMLTCHIWNEHFFQEQIFSRLLHSHLLEKIPWLFCWELQFHYICLQVELEFLNSFLRGFHVDAQSDLLQFFLVILLNCIFDFIWFILNCWGFFQLVIWIFFIFIFFIFLFMVIFFKTSKQFSMICFCLPSSSIFIS